GDVVRERITSGWSAYRGKAIEPVIRRAIERLLPEARFGDALFVGGFWNRDNSIEVDLVGGASDVRSDRIDFVGSIKWLERPFGRADFASLAVQRGQIPGATDASALVGVSRSGFEVDGLDIQLTPE